MTYLYCTLLLRDNCTNLISNTGGSLSSWIILSPNDVVDMARAETDDFELDTGTLAIFCEIINYNHVCLVCFWMDDWLVVYLAGGL